MTFLDLDWIDATSFEISDDSLDECCRFIHKARTSGSSVLVHCAQVNKLSLSLSLSLSQNDFLLTQGKSRSATAVVAHLMASYRWAYSEALAAVQARRKMAEPNPTFQQRLRTFEKSPTLSTLRAALS